jgi:hypothetical protein
MLESQADQAARVYPSPASGVYTAARALVNALWMCSLTPQRGHGILRVAVSSEEAGVVRRYTNPVSVGAIASMLLLYG